MYILMPLITRKGAYKTMRKRTTTKQLSAAITNGLLQVKKVECSYKSSNQVDGISKETFLDNLASINESGVFVNFIDWHYERNISAKDEYKVDSGAMNPYSEKVVTVYLRVGENVIGEDIEKMLEVTEEE